MGADKPSELLPGTLDLLILKTLMRGRMHGYGIAQQLKMISEEVIQVGESSLYPALQRLLLNGWVKGEWGESETTAARAIIRSPRRGKSSCKPNAANSTGSIFSRFKRCWRREAPASHRVLVHATPA